MSADFRVRNLIADNTVYNTGNQTISGTKTFNSVISGNISTLHTGSAVHCDIVTWNSSSKRFQSNNIGYNIKYTSATNEQGRGEWTNMGFPNTTEDYPLDYYFNIQGETNTLEVIATVVHDVFDFNTFLTTVYPGSYQESFLINSPYSSVNNSYSYTINNVANTTNPINAIADQLTNKPTNGWVSLVCTNGTTETDGSLILRLKSHTAADTETLFYNTAIYVTLKMYS